MSSPSRTRLRRLSSALTLAALLLSTGCIYVIPAVVTGAVVSQGGGTGGNVVLIDEEADLLFTRGPVDQGDTPEGKGQTAVALQLRVTATKATTLDRLVFSITGSGDDNALTNVGLFEDANSNALKDDGERQLGSSTVFSGDEGTATFANLQESIAAGQSLDLVLVFDIPLASFDNQTHTVELRSVQDVTADTVLLSGESRSVEVLGLPVRGGTKTVSATGALSLRPGPSTPVNQTVFPNAQSIVMSQFELRTTSVEAVNVQRLIVNQEGSGDLASAVSRADLYQDVNGDGLLDAGDQAITLNAVPIGQEVRFENLAQVIPASGIVQWLVVYTFSGAGVDGASFRSDIKFSSNVTATGVLSNQTIGPSGFPIVSTTTITLQRATLNVTAGPFPGGGQASPGQGSVPVLQLQLTTGPAEPVTLSSLRVSASGTGNESTDIASARLFVDSNGDGSPVGETTQLGPVLVYAADDGTITFSGFQRTIAANTTEFWVLSYDVAAGASAGVNFQASVTPASDFTATGQTSTLQIAPTGSAFSGGQLDVTGSLSSGPGPVMPPPASVFANDANVPVLQLRLSAGVGEPIRLTGLNVRPAGAANDQADITSVDLYLDSNSDGVVNAGDVLLQSSTYPADDQLVGFGNPAGLIPGDIPSGASRDLLVRYQLSGQAFQDETFTARVEPADITVIGANSGLTLNPGGSTAQSSTVSVRRARFSLSTGPQNPGDSDALAGQPNLPTLQLRLAVGPGEDATMNSLTIRGSGNADDASDIQNATLYLDRGTVAGAVDAGDLQLAPAQVFSADDGFVLFNTAAVASFTAGTTHDLLVAYQVSPTSNTPRTFNSYFAGAAEITGTGTSSTLSAQTQGGTITGGNKTVRRGSLAVAAGANMPAATPVFPNVQNLSVLQLALTAGFPEGVQVNSVRVVASGTADEAQAVTTLRMVLDQNGDGFAAASDPVLGTSAIANDGAVTFNLPALPAAGSLEVPAGQTRNLLFVYDLSGVSIPPGDLRLELQATTDITTTGLISAQPIPPTGTAPIAGNQIPLQLGTLALSTTAANPAAGDVLRNQQGAGMLQIRAVTGPVESVRVDSIRVTHTGTGDPATDVTLARLYFDANANGILDADTQLATTTFSGTTATFTIPGGFSIASVDSSHFLVVYDFNANATGTETFQANLNANADVSAVGNSSTLSIPPSGAPLSGGLKTLRQATLALSNGLNAPTNRSVFRDEQDVPVIQLRLDAGPAEPVEVTSVRVIPTGTGNSTTEISRVRLYLEGDPADGVLNGDQLIGDFANYAGGPLTIAPTSSVSIPAGGNKSLLLIVDHNAPASAAGTTFGAQVQATTDIVARGVISADPVAPSGIPPAVGAEHTIQEASLTLAQGDAPVGDGTIAIVQTGVAVLQAKISAGPAEAVSITSMTLTFVGTASPTAGITAVRLFRDNNNNGILDGDPLIATSTYGGGGTLTYSLAPGALIVPAAGFAHVLIAYDVGGTVNDLDTFSVQIAAAADLSGVGQSSSLPVPSGGTFPLNGATKTARQRTLTIQSGIAIPDQNVFINQSAVRALTIRATAGSGEGIRITGITLRGDPAGTGNDTGISVRLYRDQNADGLLDAGDSLVGTQVFAADAGPVTYAISPSLDAPPAGTLTMLAVYDLPNTAANNDTFRLRFNATTDISAVGATSGAPATYLGGPFPLNGSLMTAIRSSLTISAPTQVPVDEITRNEQNIPMVRFRAAVTGVEDVKLTSVTVRPDGAATGDATDAQVRLFQDVNNNGTLETGTDTQLGSTQAGSATSVTFTNPAGFLNVPAGGAQDLLVVWDYDGTPTPGQTFAARINAGDVAAIGSNTGGAITVSGGPFLGGTQTVTDPSVALATGPQNPTASLEFPGTANLPMLQVRVTAGTVETVRMTQVSVAAIGSGNDATDLTQVRLFRDDNNNGVLDGDTLLGTAAGGYPADNGTINFAITPGLLDIPAGGFRDLLVVYDLGPGAVVGEAYQARITNASLTGQGLVSAIAATRSGPTVTGGVKRVDLGSLAVSAGANNPGPGTSLRNASNVSQLQLNLTTGPAEAVQVTQVVVNASGTGDDLADLVSASLYLDDGDGVVSGGDTLLLGGQVYAANDGTLTFPGLTLVIPASSTRQLLVSYLYNGAGTVGETYAARLQTPATDISAVGVSSTATVTPTGGTVAGGANTLIEGTLSAAAGANNPGASNRLRNARNVPTIQLALTAGPAEPIRVTQVVFRGSGSGDEVADISSASLYLDDGDGVVSGGDTLLQGAQTYSADDGSLTFTGLTQVVPAGATRNLLVVYDFNAAAAGGAFTARVQAPAADILATGVTTSLAVTPSGPLVSGGATTLVEASLALSAGANNPGPSTRLRNASPVSQLQLTLTAGAAEAVRVTQVVVNGSGSGSEVADVTSAAIYLDEGDGVVGPGDTLLQANQTYSGDNGTLTFSGLTQVVPASGSVDLLVVYSYNAAVGGGDFTATLQTPSSDVTAVGVDSALSVTPSGPTIAGGATTLAEASLTLSAGANNPGASNRLRNATPVSQLQLTLTAGAAEAVRVTQVVVNGSGGGSEVADVTSAALYLDEGDGVVGPGDTLLQANQTYSGDNGTLTFSGLTQVVPASGSVNLLVVYSYNAAGAGGDFTATLQTAATDLSAVGVDSAQAVTPAGPTVSGGATTLIQASLALSAGANNPGASNRLRNATPVSQLQLALTAGSAEAVRVTQVVVNGSGGGSEVADVTSAALYLDEGDGVVGAGDTLLQANQTYSGDNGTLTFAGLTQVVPAGGSINLLVVYSYNAAGAGGDFTATLQTAGTDVTAVGVVSALAVTPSGPTTAGGTTTLIEGTLAISAGANNPGASTRLRNATPVSQLQLALTAGSAEAIRVTQVVVNGSGGGSEVADVTSAALYLDEGDGVVGAGDTLLQANQTYSGDNGTLTFTGLTQVVPAGATRNLLVVYSYNAAAPGGDFTATLQTPGTDVTAVGVDSALAVTPSGPTVAGGTTTLAEGSLAVSAGGNNPGASNQLRNATPVSQLQLNLSAGAAEPIRVTQVVVNGSGSGSEVADVTSAALYLDQGDGLVGPGDTLLLANQTYSGDDGTLTFAGLTQVVPAGGSVNLLVVYSYNAAAAGGTFTATLQTPGTDVTAVGVNSAQAVTPTGPTVAGGTTTLVEASLSIAAGANNPAASNQLRNATPVSQLQLLLTAGAGEDVRVTQVVINASGTGDDVADVSSASLYLDDGDGLVGGGDTLLLANQTYSGNDGTLTFAGLTQVIPAGSSRNLLVVYSYVAAAAGGDFAARLQTPSADVTAVGVSSAQSITPSGPTVNGGLVTLVEPSLAASLGPNNPAASNIQAGTTGVELLQLRLTAGTAESVQVSNIRLTPSGTGNDATGITAVALYNDQNGNGVLDGDPLLVNSAWAGDDTATNFAVSLSVPAGGFRDVLVVVNVAAGAAINDTFRAALAANADITAVGQVSALTLTPSGAPLAGNFKTVVTTAQIVASQSVVLAPGIAVPNSESVVLPLRLSETSGLDAVRLESLRVRASGSGGDDTDITFVRLYRDTGTLGVIDGDVQIGLSAFFADDGLATFAGLSEVIPASGVGNFLVSYTFAGAAQATDGETYTAAVQVGGLTLVEVGSGQSVTPSGLPQTGPQRTILGADLAASAGTNNPGAVSAAPNEADVEILQLQLSTNQAGGATISNLTLQAGVGSGDDSAGIAAATLYEDLDGDGQVGPGDRSILRVANPFSVDGGTASFAISETIAASSSVIWLVAYEMTGAVAGGQTFTVSASAITANPTSTSGLPVAGGTITVAGNLTLSQGGAPTRRVLGIPSGPEEAALVTLSADAAEAWTLTALTVQASGTADDVADVGQVRAWLDDGDGVFEPGADDGAALATATFGADDGAATLSALGQAIPASGSVSLWISLDVNGAATAGRSFRVAVMDGSQVAATGDVSGSTAIRGGRVAGSSLDLGFDTTLFGGSSVAALNSAEVVTALASGDLDGNGDQDYVALRGDGRVEVRLGDGSGTTFALKGTFFGPNRLAPRRVALGDLNRDGWLDVILAFDTRVTVFTNQGLADPGNLNAAVEFAEAGATYQDLALVDYDRDGDLDVVLIDRTAPRVRGRRNDGSGGLATTDALALVNLPRRLVAADFDRDGRVDLAISDDSNQVRLARGDGSFFGLSDADAGNASGGLVASDLDRDGFPDLLGVDGTGSLLPYLSDAPATGTLTAQAAQASAPSLTQTTPEDIARADLDGNGIFDFLVPHSGTDGLVARIVSASVVFPTTGDSAYATGTDPDRVTVADFNGDADPDAIVGSTAVTGQVEVVLGDGQTKGGLAALTSASALGWTDFAAGIASGDLDRDGRPDLVAVGATNLGVSLQSSDLAFSSLTDTTLAGAAGGVALGDVNRDGILDVVVTIRSLTQDRVEVYPGQGNGTFGAPFSALTSGDTNPRALVLLDKDRNGVLDALVAEGSALQLYRGNGTSLSNAQLGDNYSAPSPVNAVLSGDFNRDGQADVAAICSAGTLEVRLGSAGFGFGGAASTPLAAGIGTPSAATLADVDQDGLVDVIVAGALGLEILRGDGAGGFTSQVVETTQAGLTGIAALDLDKDGDLDLLAPHGTGWALYVSSGGFTFALPVTQGANAGASLEGLVVTDLDGDGDQDALFGSQARELQSALGR